MHIFIPIGVLLLIIMIWCSDDRGGLLVPLAIFFMLPWIVMIGIGLFGMATN